MKISILSLLEIVLLTGCKPEPDPRIAKLEARFEQMKANMLEINSMNSNLLVIIKDIDKKQAADMEEIKPLVETLRLELLAHISYDQMIRSEQTNKVGAYKKPHP